MVCCAKNGKVRRHVVLVLVLVRADFEIVTVDIVAQPSAPNAYPRTVYESLMNMKGGSRVVMTAREALNEAAAQKQLVKDLQRFIQELKI